jgi:uncharacterized membrane protein
MTLMQDNKHIEWLLTQLPDWVSEQILSQETADAIAGRYRPMLAARSSQNRISLALAIIGAILIGGGIILLFAHNWSEFSRPFRAFLSFLPLLVSQGLTLYAFLFINQSRPWQEATVLVHALLIGSSMALIGQTYHLPSSMPAFMLTWVLLAIPMSWVIHSISLHVMLHLGVFIWFFQAPDSLTRNLTLIGLALVLAPLVIPFRKVVLPGAGHSVTRWSAALALLFIVPNMLIRDIGSTILICFSLLLSVYSLLESGKSFQLKPFRDKPFSTIGNAGIFIILLLCTIPEIWSEFILPRESNNNIVLIFALLALNIFLLATYRHQLNPAKWIIGLTGPLTFFAAMISGKGTSKLLFYWVFCAWLAGLGIALLRAGFKDRRLSQVNLGMSVLLVHIVIQFMRADVGYLVRSIVFIVLGILFLTFNRALSNRWRVSS